MMISQLPATWTPRQPTAIERLDGRYVTLEKLDFERHSDGLRNLSKLNGLDRENQPAANAIDGFIDPAKDNFDEAVRQMAHSKDPEYYAVVEKGSGLVAGYQSFTKIDPTSGVLEISPTNWDSPLQVVAEPTATEAFYLAARHAFDTLHYCRLAWTCDNLNTDSKRAARRLGFTFEGIHRWQCIQEDGGSRDTATYSILDSEWPPVKRAMEKWLDGATPNKRLEDVRRELGWTERDLGVPDFSSQRLKVSKYAPRAYPSATRFEGRFVLIESLSAAKHTDGLYSVSTLPDAPEKMYYMREKVPTSRAQFTEWMHMAEASRNPLYFAVIDKKTGRVGGRQCITLHDQDSGVAEMDWVYWGPGIARRPAATEALYLFARYMLDELGYRRFEWRCLTKNGPSLRAARRFGFKSEAVGRQVGFHKGASKDIAVLSIVNDGREWPLAREAMETWLRAENFDAEGKQRRRLIDIREALAKKGSVAN